MPHLLDPSGAMYASLGQFVAHLVKLKPTEVEKLAAVLPEDMADLMQKLHRNYTQPDKNVDTATQGMKIVLDEIWKKYWKKRVLEALTNLARPPM